MALEPGGLKDQLVTAAADGEMKMIDFRMLPNAAAAPASGGGSGGDSGGGGGGGGALGVWKTVKTSATSRNLSALVAHPHAPLLATGTATQACVRLHEPRTALPACVCARSEIAIPLGTYGYPTPCSST